MLWWLDVPLVTRCRALIAEGSPGSLMEAEERLNEYAEMNEAHHNTFQLIKILTLLAVLCEKQNKEEEGLEFLERAVTMARRGDLVFPFVELGPQMAALLRRYAKQGDAGEFVRRLLAAFSDGGAAGPVDRPPAGSGSTLDDLTHREFEILQLLAQRLHNKEIAARLYISTHTVNDHLKHIYQKLGVSGRRQAVDRAVEMGLMGRSGTG
jgi:LuxR family maltose regulon positive regulatory protein